MKRLVPVLVCVWSLVSPIHGDPGPALEGVRLEIQEGGAWRPDPASPASGTALATGDALPVGTLLKTDDAFAGRLVYPDGTTLTVKPGSQLQVLDDGLRLLRGSVWIKVVRVGGGFHLLTPSVIASVRGTVFSGEVLPVESVALRAMLREMDPESSPSTSWSAPALSDRLGWNLIRRILSQARGGQVPSLVQVFEGTVAVSIPDPRTGKILSEVLLRQGDSVSAAGGRLAPPSRLAASDYRRWDRPVPAGVEEAPAATGTSGPDDPATPRDPWFRGPPVRILDQE